MSSNDKIENMASAAVADLLGTASRLEVCTAFATVPVTKGLDLEILRRSIFTGGTGYTATDPITAGAALLTTGVFTAAAGVGNVVTVRNTTATGTGLNDNPILKIMSSGSGADTSIHFTDSVTANGFFSWKSSKFTLTPATGSSSAEFNTTGAILSGTLKSVGAFGCNNATPQTPAVSGGTVGGVITALIACGILSS